MKRLSSFLCGATLVLSTEILLAAPPAVEPASDIPGQAEFYSAQEVQTVRLQIAAADQRRMQEALPKCIYVPATFQWRDTIIENVAVRFKGNSSSSPQQQHKRSYLIRFDKYEDDQRFLGLRRASFDNGVQFGSLFSEPIITEILRAEGIKTHRCNYAKVFLNEQYQGVYVNVERIDETFIEQHFPDSNGSLWKNDLGGPGGDLQFIGDDPKQYGKAFETKNKAAKKHVTQLVGFIKVINQTPDEDFAHVLQSKMDVDSFLRVTSVMLLSGAFDQLTGWGPHNFYLYHDPKQDRWHYLPWDLDVGFCEIAFGRVYVLEDWNAAWPVPTGHRNPLLDRVIANPQLLARYRSIAAEVLEKHFSPDRLCAAIDAKYALIKPHLQKDPFPHRRATVPGDRNYDDIVASQQIFVRKRYQTAHQQQQNPGRRPTPIHRPDVNPPQAMPPELGGRIQQVMQRAQAMQQKVQQIHGIMQQVGPLVQQGKVAEAEKLIEHARQLTE